MNTATALTDPQYDYEVEEAFQPTVEDYAALEELREQMAAEQAERRAAVDKIIEHFATRRPVHHRCFFSVQDADGMIERALGRRPTAPGAGLTHSRALLANAGVDFETLRKTQPLAA